MGAKTWMLVGCDGNARALLAAGPVLDRVATREFAGRLFANDKLTELEDGDLSMTCPPDGELVIGCFAGLTVVAAKECAADFPSRFPAVMLAAIPGQTVYLHAMHSAVDWFAFAVWHNGQLQRALGVSPDSGIEEDIGAHLPFERPYWAGEHPVDDPDDETPDYPLDFHPLELGEAALLALFGYQLEGGADAQVDPANIALMRFKRSRT